MVAGITDFNSTSELFSIVSAGYKPDVDLDTQLRALGKGKAGEESLLVVSEGGVVHTEVFFDKDANGNESPRAEHFTLPKDGGPRNILDPAKVEPFLGQYNTIAWPLKYPEAIHHYDRVEDIQSRYEKLITAHTAYTNKAPDFNENSLSITGSFQKVSSDGLNTVRTKGPSVLPSSGTQEPV